MKKYFGIATVILFALSIGALGILFAGAAGPLQIGVAAAVKGEVKDTPEGKATQFLKSGDKVFMGDMIETGKDGQLQVLLLDQTVFTLGPLSALKMDRFVYDPNTDDGAVKVSMMKGIFRVVSGKIAHKKPENMSVDLPAGTIGFRGTNVAGIIDGSKSLIVLLGPVGAGRISVSNVVNGEIFEVDIDEAGKGTIVGGPNIAPVPVFQVSAADLDKIATALGQSMTGGQAETISTNSPESAGSPDSLAATDVDAQTLLNLLSIQDEMSQQSQDAAQDIADTKSGSSHQASSKSSSEDGNVKYTVTSH